MDDQERERHASRVKWSRDARRRAMKRFLRAFLANQEMRYRFGETEELMERMAEDYRRAFFAGAHLPPMSTVQVTVETVCLERSPRDPAPPSAPPATSPMPTWA